ncbi:glycosyltransferase family 2 protein (plasmid) [Entomospira nematocerorum]|uniref:Glycosyltransferase family 2 protein n=1 Tax=Entomospira nematocerorum TaxID=2719987 RepID=A0A968KTP4_9SPIO|nr:glycosyltransferase family 2 protein [Entomospira nematocera]NIZ47596.1 glycosyltransferase family 2 protein [Entomospira nematocera]WDI34600.1 glycosyltransferase family 2 protein [Entomospira nematocera]
MKISLIIPFYNVEAYLGRCLESIIAQTYTNLEIILIDDCSTDNSSQIAQDYARQDNRIRVMKHNENKQQSGARNTGLRHATGDYIWFIDSDDQIASHHSMMALVAALEHHNAPDVLIFGFTVYKVGDQLLGKSYIQSPRLTAVTPKDIAPYFAGERWYYTSIGEMVWNKLFRRSFLDRIGATFQENMLYEDNITPYWIFCADRILLMPEMHYHYYLRHGSTTTSDAPANFVEHRIRYMEQAVAFIQRHPALQLYQGYLTLFLLRQVFDPRLARIIASYDRRKQRIVTEQLVRSFLAGVDTTTLIASLQGEHTKIMAEQILHDSVREFVRLATQGSYVQAYRILSHQPRWIDHLLRVVKLCLPYALVRMMQQRRASLAS